MSARTVALLAILALLLACGESDTPSLPVSVDTGLEPVKTMTTMLTAEPQPDASRRRTTLALHRIESQDRYHRAILHLNPNAERIATERDSGPAVQRGVLHGIPVLVKDNIETADMPTTAGAHALAGLRTGRDAGVIRRLREAGAIILGKTNLSEWANFRSERASSGWSGLGGQTRNAVDRSRSPCGSSSGSAVAVALGYVPLAIGTETNGSVICPASINGVVGFKPSVGALPGDGIIPIAHSQDSAGPLTLTVADAALAYAVMAGLDHESVLAEVRAGSANGLRIGILRGASGYHEGVDALFDIAIAELRRNGATLVDELVFSPYEGFGGDTHAVLLHEFKHDLNVWFAALPEPGRVSSLEELIAFNIAHAEEAMPYFGQEIFIMANATEGLDSDDYREALARIRRATREDGIDAMLAEHDLDVLIAPSTGPAWSIDLVNGDHYLGGFSTYPAVAGYPHLTVPMGTAHGLPIGLSITSRRDADLAVLALGHAFEQLGSLPNIGAPLPQH